MSAVTGEVGVTVVAGVTVEDGGPKVGIAPVASSVETGIAEVGDAVEAGGSEFDCSLEAGGADASSEYAADYFWTAASLIFMATVAIGRNRETMGITSIYIGYDRGQWELTF